MSIEAVINERDATYTVTPEHGRRVVFEVRWREVPVTRLASGVYGGSLRERFVVSLQGSDGAGFATFLSFEKACRSALWRARRYDKAYSMPRGIRATARRAA